MSKNRKQYSADQKVAIFRRHLIDKVPVSDLCDEYQIHPTLFYRWQTQLFENAATGFQRQNLNPQAKHLKTIENPQAKHLKTIEQLQQKLQGKNEVVSEIMEAGNEQTQITTARKMYLTGRIPDDAGCLRYKRFS